MRKISAIMQKDRQELVAKALELGASAARFIDVPSIRTGAWTRWKCQFGCPNYGSTLCCPPYAPDYETTQKFLNEYAEAILVQYTCEFPQGDDVDWHQVDRDISNKLLELLLALEIDAFKRNYYKAFALKAGRCHLCETCNLKKCVNPTKARPSAEACGIDVMALANDHGFEAKVLTGPVKELRIYGLVLVD